MKNWLLIFFSSLALADQSPAPSKNSVDWEKVFRFITRQECDKDLTIDQRFRWARWFKDPNEVRKVQADLLTEALTPYLIRINEEVLKIPVGELQQTYSGLAVFPIESQPDDDLSPLRSYDGQYWNESYYGEWYVPFTHANKSSMAKLLKVMLVMEGLIRRHADWITDSIRESRSLRARATSSSDIFETIDFAILTTVDVAAQLTSEAKAGLGEDELLHRVFQSEQNKASLATQLSLMIPPATGPLSSQFYFPDSVEKTEDGRVVLSETYRYYITDLRREFMKRGTYRPIDTGHGCPVGRRLRCNPIEKVGLQYFADTVLYIYDHMKD